MAGRRKDSGAAEEPARRSADEALNAALRLLSIRARSRHELTLALHKRGYDDETSAQVLQKLAGFGYLDDVKFARDRALTLLRHGRFGARAVLQRLVAHGIGEAAAKRALQEAEAELAFDPLATARSILDRRGLLGRPLSPKEQAKAARLLLGRGFSRSVVGALVGEVTPSEDDE